MKKNQIDFITMGCSKNLVDSEQLMRRFENIGYHCNHDPKHPQGEIAVINTCGFIESAKEESINTILEFANAKNNGRISKLFVMGCLSQRYQKELEESLPEVDKFYGKFNFTQLLKDLGPAKDSTSGLPPTLVDFSPLLRTMLISRLPRGVTATALTAPSHS